MSIDALQSYRQWVIHRADKIPLRVSDLRNASCTNPIDWTDYATAKSFVSSNPEYGLGFVLTDNDPFAVIDLDTHKIEKSNLSVEQKNALMEKHVQIYNAFDSFTEVSPSGRGAHIWCEGSVKSKKFSSEFIEVYSKDRYITVTENVTNDKSIENRQELLNKLIEFLSGNTENTPVGQNNKMLSDDEICRIAANASNGELFKQLWLGNWEGKYPSQSEADISFCNIVAYYTDDKEQVGRIYWNSQLFLNSPKRKRKSKSDYLYNPQWGIVSKAFDQKIPPIDISGIQKKWEEKSVTQTITEPAKIDSAITFPQGLLGDVAQYIYSSSVLPNAEVAIAGAITLLAGIAGRAYNTCTGTGLNQYIVLLAGTGQGKEGAARGMSRIFKCVQKQVPAISQFAGPSEIASPQALLKYFAESPCMWSHKNEFGFWLQKLNSKYAKGNELTLKAMLLDLFHKSGKDDILMGAIYSDKQKNAPMVKAPALTLYGESTPEEFYRAVDEANIAEGLISRLTILPVPDVRPDYNPTAGQAEPSAGLVWRVAGLCKRVLELDQTGKTCIVGETDAAKNYQLEYQQKCMDLVWENRNEIVGKIWQRAHIRLLRLGALLAVGINPDNPCVTLDCYAWAKQIIDCGAQALIDRFHSGEIGEVSYVMEQRKVLRNLLEKYANSEWNPKWAGQFRITYDMWKMRAIPFSAIYQKTQGYSCFRKDRNPSQALFNLLRDFEQAEYIVKCDAALTTAFGKRANVWLLTGNI